MTYELHRHDARRVSELLEPESVDLIVTSPPYFALRSYQDGGEHYAGQIGSEPTPAEFVDALVACTADWLRVLRPGGSLFVNLGDKYAGSRPDGSSGNGIGTSTLNGHGADGTTRDVCLAPGNRRRSGTDGIAAKSLMGLPWRYALRCIDELGLILRAEIIWSKPNGLPESVTDRVRRSHEQWFHLVREPRYFAAIDEVREAHQEPERIGKADSGSTRRLGTANRGFGVAGEFVRDYNPLGKVPGSVWSIPSEPLVVPDDLGVDHFAAFPSEWPRRLILGWTPSGYCTACGEPRRAVVDRRYETVGQGRGNERYDRLEQGHGDLDRGAFKPQEMRACPDTTAPTRPAVVLDPFAGTGTTVAVAHLLDRHGIGTDLSADYLRLAEWRCTSDRALRDKVLDRSGIPNPDPPKIGGQLDLFGEVVA